MVTGQLRGHRAHFLLPALFAEADPGSSATNFLLDIEKIGCFQALSSRHCLGPRSNVPSDTNFAGLRTFLLNVFLIFVSGVEI